MTTAFQADSFQANGFQYDEIPSPPPPSISTVGGFSMLFTYDTHRVVEHIEPWHGVRNMENQDRADLDEIVTIILKSGMLH